MAVFCHRSFLTQCAAVLNWNTTTTLLESYGRLEELEVFAGAKGDQEALLEYLMRNPDGAKRRVVVPRHAHGVHCKAQSGCVTAAVQQCWKQFVGAGMHPCTVFVVRTAPRPCCQWKAGRFTFSRQEDWQCLHGLLYGTRMLWTGQSSNLLDCCCTAAPAGLLVCCASRLLVLSWFTSLLLSCWQLQHRRQWTSWWHQVHSTA